MVTLSTRLTGIPHRVLNARNSEYEAEIIARSGQIGAVTISTNMAGRGVDIQLGRGVSELGGLHVIGTNRHESRRIDNQLRGRCGRQGDPGSSRFYISREDDIFAKWVSDESDLTFDADHLQQAIEGHNLDIREFLNKYEWILEHQRQVIHQERQQILIGARPCSSEDERLATLTTIDDLWSDHIAAVAALREGIQWASLGGRDPLHVFLKDTHAMFQELQDRISPEVAVRVAASRERGNDPTSRGAVWTYLTTDQPFGSGDHRFFAGLARKFKKRRLWG